MSTGKKIKSLFLSVSGIALALLSAGCVFNSREITVSEATFDYQIRDYFRNELINQDGLTFESENFLRGNLLKSDFSSNPQLTLTKLNEFYELSGNPKFLNIAADLCHYLSSRSSAEKDISFHLSTYYYCMKSMLANKQRAGKSSFDDNNEQVFTFAQISRYYNEACCGIFTYLNSRNILNADSVSLKDAEGHTFVMDKPAYFFSVNPEKVQKFALCALFSVKDLMQMNRRAGIGVPLVAWMKEGKLYKSLKTPSGLTIPVTMLVRPEQISQREIKLKLIFIDTYTRENFRQSAKLFNGQQWPLSLDFSTPLACFLNDLRQRNLLSMMLNPRDQEASDGLYMIEPFQPKKIPVVFIHGLMSSPETWVQMINSLKNDPQIRARYQFWFFSYSTGSPVMLSANKLREALLAAEKELCTTPEIRKNFDKMVLVGHSMGGMLTRCSLQENPHYIMETLLGHPWSEIKAKLKPEDFKLVDSFTLYPLPFVHRAVFMAVPHKGADMAKRPIARFGASIITLPVSLLKHEPTVRRISKALNDGKSSKGKIIEHFYTGIDNLDPDNRFVLALSSSAIKKDVTYHCIIGNANEDGAPGGSDGVVPYWSSHLNDAASELVVKSDHSVHRRPAAIQELLRILLLHLKETDAAVTK